MFGLLQAIYDNIIKPLFKWKKTFITLFIACIFLWVFAHLINDMMIKFNLREGLKCDSTLPHLIPEVNNSKGVKVKENFWHDDDD